MFPLKITIITQFKLTLYSFVCNHILHRLYLKTHFIPFMHYIPLIKVELEKNLNLLFSFLQFSISPYFYHYFLSSFFEEEISTETSKIICSIYWNQVVFKIVSVVIKTFFEMEVGKKPNGTSLNSKIYSLFPVK